MPTTFNQVPPIHQASPVFFTCELGDIMFTSEETVETVKVYRSQANLHMTFKNVEFCIEIADNDTEIDNLLFAFWEMTR